MSRLRTVSVLLMAAVLFAGCRPPASRRVRLEERLAAEGRVLVLVPYGVPADAASRSLCFGLDTLRATPLYLRHRRDPGQDMLIGGGGTVERGGEPAGQLSGEGELLVTRDGISLFLDHVLAVPDLADWEIFWAGHEERLPEVRDTCHPVVDASDGFMRHELPSDECRVVSGDWLLHQHGGGMPQTEEEESSYSVERAVNPFSVRGTDGMLAFGLADWDQFLGEASAYFGVRPEGDAVDCHTMPTGSDFLVALGDPQGVQAGFGWFGGERTWALATRDGAGAWALVERLSGPRPPLTNWVRLGIGVHQGGKLEAWLDGRIVLQHQLRRRVQGPFLLIASGATTEWDDVRVRSYPLAEAAWTPIWVRSATFASKQRKNNSDPAQFGEWARGQDAFAIGVARGTDGALLRSLFTQRPLLGDWRYESVGYSSRLGPFPAGHYRFQLLTERAGEPGQPEGQAAVILDAVRAADGWEVSTGGRTTRVSGELSFRRAAEDGWRVALRQGDAWLPVSAPVPGPSFLRVNRVSRPGEASVFPRPEHHALFCRNLVADLFETVPTDWSWIEGQCRMAARWACQDQWNFLACGGTGVPFMVSKRRFEGVQTHEYFMAMRPMTPSDAGDASFRYNPKEDEKLQVFHEHLGWYNRRDLNFSFCGDGRNPFSGYTVVFGGEDNTVTRLYRQGKVLAETREPQFLFAPGPDHTAIHWRWWKFTIHLRGEHLRVLLDDQTLFAVDDPEPLTDGHVAFWTVRNGFSLTKVSSLADHITWEPDVLYVPDSPVSSGWQSVLTDSLALAPAGAGMTQVTLTTGSGFHPLRYVFPTPVPLAASPCLRLPLQLPPEVALNAFVETSAGSFVVDLGAGLAGMKSFATPPQERGECFQLPDLASAEVEKGCLRAQVSPARSMECNVLAELVRLGVPTAGVEVRSLTLAQTGNVGYALAAGNGRNRAGTSYRVGEPVFGPRAATTGEAGHE